MHIKLWYGKFYTVRKYVLRFFTIAGNKSIHFLLSGIEKNACDKTPKHVLFSSYYNYVIVLYIFTCASFKTKSCIIRFCIQNFGFFLNLSIVKTRFKILTNPNDIDSPLFKYICFDYYAFGILRVYIIVPYIRLRNVFNINLWWKHN